MDGTWLLTLIVDQRALRYSVAPHIHAGVAYRGGLQDLVMERGASQGTVQLTDPSIPWSTLAQHAAGTVAVLELLDALGERIGVLRGRVVGVQWGADDEPVVIDISADDVATALPVIDTLARVDVDTWPVDIGSVLGEVGRTYPLVFGTPGWEGSGTAYPVVPVPVGETHASVGDRNVAVVCEDASAFTGSTARIRNVEANLEVSASLVTKTDLLKRAVRCAQLDLILPSTTVTYRYYAGFAPATSGSGVASTVYDAIFYVLERWAAPEDVDWGRLPQVADVLAPFRVDTWIDAPDTNPWEWVAYITQYLPVELRTGERGRYFVHRRSAPDPRRRVGPLSVAEGELQETAPLALDVSRRANEFSATYRFDRDNRARGRIVLTGREGVQSAPRFADPGSTRMIYNALCHQSQASYGLVVSPTISLDWTWDEATVIGVLGLLAEQNALPQLRTSYLLLGDRGRQLAEGDEFLLDDPVRGLNGRVAIITGPPVFSSTGTQIDVAIPQQR